jgi:hypothetical protein
MSSIKLPGAINQEQRGEVIEFFSILSGDEVTFKAFLTSFTDDFQSDWTPTEVYGRMDPIQNYKGTTRTINLGWDCVAEDFEEARENMIKCSRLFKMLYPSYEGSTLKGSPLVKLKFMNLITSSDADVSSKKAKDSGLVGTIDGFSYSPDLNNGFFQDVEGVYPQSLNLECTFVVLHTHELGYNTTTNGMSPASKFKDKYPYNVSTAALPTSNRSPNTSTGNRGPIPDSTAGVGNPSRRAEAAAANLNPRTR